MHASHREGGRVGVTAGQTRRAAALGGTSAGVLCGVALLALPGLRVKSAHIERLVSRPCGIVARVGGETTASNAKAVVGSAPFTVQISGRQTKRFELCPTRTATVLVKAYLVSGSGRLILKIERPCGYVRTHSTLTRTEGLTASVWLSGRVPTIIAVHSQTQASVLRLRVLAQYGLLSPVMASNVAQAELPCSPQ
jgi:hypothetical protein